MVMQVPLLLAGEGQGGFGVGLYALEKNGVNWKVITPWRESEKRGRA